MAAGLGFKTFTTGEVLTSADTNGYLMQGVLVFASTAARDAAITSPQEGQFAFTKDNNSLWYYSGAAWVASGATGDIEGVTAGTGISGGGTSGTVTITNSMATEITAKADLIVGTGNAAFDNLPVGANETVLTADSTVSPTGLKWAAPAGGGALTLISSTVIGTTVSSITVSSAFSSTYENYLITVNGGVASTNLNLNLQLGSTTTGYYGFGFFGNSSSSSLTGDNINNAAAFSYAAQGDTNNLSGQIYLQNPNLAKATTMYTNATRTGGNGMSNLTGSETSSTQHTAFTLITSTGTVTGGTIRVYGYQNS